ncbi:MAG: hypothetical protein KIT69_14840, partial [Propionibacteriaceae bacterium]|nr:hypothetical protein [Propionibacteriaceae bacterium]
CNRYCNFIQKNINNGYIHPGNLFEIKKIIKMIFPKQEILPGKLLTEGNLEIKYIDKQNINDELINMIGADCWGVYITGQKNRLIKNYFNTRELEKKYPRLKDLNGDNCSWEEYLQIPEVKKEKKIRKKLTNKPSKLLKYLNEMEKDATNSINRINIILSQHPLKMAYITRLNYKDMKDLSTSEYYHYQLIFYYFY